MKIQNLLLVLFLLPLFASAQENETADTLKINGVEKGDTLEYELIVFDPGFNSWYNMVQQPMSFYSQDYLEMWNERLVRQWNNQVPASQRSNCLSNTYIDYDPNINYGMELNHKLFYFFRYIDEKCGVFYTTPSRW
ncbi:MAG: DUF6146 family protein [Bacteroidales bacterium]